MTLQDITESYGVWIGDLVRKVLKAQADDPKETLYSRHEFRCDLRDGKLQVSVHQQEPGAAVPNCIFMGTFSKAEAKRFLDDLEPRPVEKVEKITIKEPGAGAESRIEAIRQIASKYKSRVNQWSGESGQTRYYINLDSADRKCAGDQKTKLWFDENGKVTYEPGSGKKSAAFKADLEKIRRELKATGIEVAR